LRTVFKLFEFEQMSMTEVARALRPSAGHRRVAAAARTGNSFDSTSRKSSSAARCARRSSRGSTGRDG
jgi:hypothetical protein